MARRVAVLFVVVLLCAGCVPGAVDGPNLFGAARPGLQFSSTIARDAALDEMQALGVRWIRLDLAWSDIQRNGPGTWSWGAYDELVNDVRARGIKILATLTYTPPWASSAPGPYDNAHKQVWEKYAPNDVNHYATFAGVVATRYRDRIDAYEIWNEANIDDFWKPLPDAAKYAAMLRAANGTITAADPDAIVVSSGLAPYGRYGDVATGGRRINPLTFLQQMYANGARGHFDALGWHPYNWTSGPPSEPVDWNAWHQIDKTWPNAVMIMAANGDAGKKVWLTEWAYPSSGSTTRTGTFTEARQAQWLLEGYYLAATSPWAGPLFWFTIEDNRAGGGLESAGLLRGDRTRKAAWTTYRDAVRAVGG